MPPPRPFAFLASIVAPPRCGVCGDPCAGGDPLCARCAAALAAARGRLMAIPGADAAWATAPYDGVARRLVAALKFRGRLALAGAAAAAITGSLPAGLAAGTVVPVPLAPARGRARGFDPTALIAGELARRLGLGLEPCLRRGDGPRQVGRPRLERLGDPPAIAAAAPAPATVTLVDDVATTGATLGAAALALRAAGAGRIVAVAFARTPGLAEGAAWA